MRRLFYWIVLAVLGLNVAAYFYWQPGLWSLLVFGPLILVGFRDVIQKRQAIRRNFPIVGHFRYILEKIRPEIQQYFIEMNDEGMPFSREHRSVIYQRAKGQLDTQPFGTQRDLYKIGYEWVNHSMMPTSMLREEPRTLVGAAKCAKPYAASLFNVSAMSYGALSTNAIRALNKGAALGGFAHNTGEGGVSPYHQEHNGDLIWQVGTGYFGCRNAQGKFDIERFKDRSALDQVKMIEIKLSQGAKPGHGGILPAAKLTKEIASIRGVPMGQDVMSPPGHSAFHTPLELIEWITQLREASGGKPVGIKFCLGKRRDFFAVVKAMAKLGEGPDFITVDGSEGGTGAAPLEFANSIGTPLKDALIFVHNALMGMDLRKDVKINVSGKVTTGFHIAQHLALGADFCSSARGMMFAIGCIQALRCNANACPAGVATQDPELVAGLDPRDKASRVFHYHKETVESFLQVLTAVGLNHPDELKPWHIMRRVSALEVKHYGDIYDYLEPGELLDGKIPPSYGRAWTNSNAEAF